MLYYGTTLKLSTLAALIRPCSVFHRLVGSFAQER